jgi:hypothetical protein
MEFREEPGFGQVAVATKHFAAGDVILTEAALLQVAKYDSDHPKHKTLEKYTAKRGVEPVVILKLASYLSAPKETQALVQQLYCPDPSLTDHHLVEKSTA